MRLSPAAAAVPVLVLLLTWLAWRAADPNAERFDRALSALDRLAMAESGLDRDVLRARAGMLRNYDPIVRDGSTIDDSLGRLRAAAAVDPGAAAAVKQLAGSIARQEALVEQFKSDNALLQNSLAYFERFSARLGAPDQAGPIAPAVSALAAAMLRLTLDTSPATAREVEAQLDTLRAISGAGDAALMHGLLTHGSMLHDLLPATDIVVKDLWHVPERQEQAAIRAMVLKHQSCSRTTARQFRLLLYLTSLLLVAVLTRLGLQLRARSRAVQRRAAFEHVLAGVSMRFINSRLADIDRDCVQALADMAECVGADRAYFLMAEPARRNHVWCRPGIPLPDGWPDKASALASRFTPAMKGTIHVPDATRLAPGAERDACDSFGLRGWACAPGVAANGVAVLLGFDAVRHPSGMTESGELGLLRMARDTLVNALNRHAMEGERSRLEVRLQQARRMETVGALASGIAHNFNNIIGAILGYAEMAGTQVDTDSRPARSLDEIRRAGERARDLIDRVLAFGRRRDARRQSLSVATMIAEAAALLRASLPAGIELVIRIAPEAATICGEPAQLQQVVVNLCRNAAQAMNDIGSVEIDVELHEIVGARLLSHGELARGHYVSIAVSDTGHGMSKPVVERIFEPFFTTRLSGNGLGLATAREVVREHGGAMNVWSAAGVGSRFEIWLPCIAALEPAQAEETPALPLGQGETVLVIADDRDRLLGDEEMLAALGYEPVGFANAGEALASCRGAAGRYDALMVGRLGSTKAALDLAATLNAVAPKLPILLATGSAEGIAADRLIAAGVSEVVARPLVAAQLAAALKRCLALRAIIGH